MQGGSGLLLWGTFHSKAHAQTLEQLNMEKWPNTPTSQSCQQQENDPGSPSLSPSWDSGLTKYQAPQQEAHWPGGYLGMADIANRYKLLKTSVQF